MESLHDISIKLSMVKLFPKKVPGNSGSEYDTKATIGFVIYDPRPAQACMIQLEIHCSVNERWFFFLPFKFIQFVMHLLISYKSHRWFDSMMMCARRQH